jgi:hypothetical protein
MKYIIEGKSFSSIIKKIINNLKRKGKILKTIYISLFKK